MWKNREPDDFPFQDNRQEDDTMRYDDYEEYSGRSSRNSSSRRSSSSYSDRDYDRSYSRDYDRDYSRSYDRDFDRDYDRSYSRDYDRYRDAVSDYNTDYSRLYNAYTDERDYDYGKYQNDLNYWLDVAQLENSDYWTRYNAALAAASSGGSSGGSGGGGYYSGDYSDALSSGKYKRTEAQDLAQVNKMDAYATGKVTSNYYSKNLTYDSVANSVAAAGNSEKANLLTENGYNLLKKRGVMSGYSSYQAYLANVLKNYGA